MRPDAVRRVLDLELTAARERRGGLAPRVVDVGGGSGVFAVPMAAAGCEVTVVEPSPNALATLQRRAQEAGVADRITAVQGDSDALDQLVEPGSAELVLAHGLLEVVDDPKVTVAAMAAVVAPGGVLSVLVANRFAAILHRAISGKLVDARALLDDPAGAISGPTEALLRRFDTEGLRALIADAGLTVELVQGYGVVADLVPGSVLESNPGAQEALAQLELVAATTPPLRDVASRLHAIARR
ncbi:class I SAM-dependent methyltransferase [Actinokineospora xionganensis]|uniref:Methyltransferase domain-containing protein n=1 Tax=Actinokineospora xionganensis TaxID=2684470 RepID=A0ABR7L4R5_9PSEU|nr:methyltransferase domain-containing protein [Actinokineospora xionganensis]MBC6447673.1 methyltransferase domain-containing protein [Actinokineospora xionganensis]